MPRAPTSAVRSDLSLRAYLVNRDDERIDVKIDRVIEASNRFAVRFNFYSFRSNVDFSTISSSSKKQFSKDSIKTKSGEFLNGWLGSS